MERLKKTLLGIMTFLCIVILTFDIACYSIQQITKSYLKKEAIVEMLNDIEFSKLLKDENGNDLEQVKEIKNKLIDSGIPSESIDKFIDSKPVHEFTGDIINKSIDQVLYNKENKIDSEYIYSFLEDNIEDISNELKNENIKDSELLTKERQQEILKKVKDKTPLIEDKINSLTTKLSEKINGKNAYIGKTVNIVKFLYSNVLTIIFILIFIIFIIGIIITRKSVYKALKWIGVSFINSSIILYIIGIIIPKITSSINEIPYILECILNYTITNLKNYSIIYLVAGIILIVLNIVIYYALIRNKNEKIEI